LGQARTVRKISVNNKAFKNQEGNRRKKKTMWVFKCSLGKDRNEKGNRRSNGDQGSKTSSKFEYQREGFSEKRGGSEKTALWVQ